MGTVSIAITVAAGLYEVLSRVVPTSKTWSIIGNVIKVAGRISDVFDNKRK